MKHLLLAVSRELLILDSIMDDSKTKLYWVWASYQIKTIHFYPGNRVTIDSQPSASELVSFNRHEVFILSPLT